ncbi:hypothetical protein [uncultured Rhodoblastus sp.]|uniref:hypothetical protein n=1 Tax=uncultured Rhodoblastus sp. TaxID=543037 RepID=UPI0025D1434D|nr:hypothetical protein [uncultured Rhodoblastus sp.]
MKKPNEFLLTINNKAGWLDRDLDFSDIISMLKSRNCSESDIRNITEHLKLSILNYEGNNSAVMIDEKIQHNASENNNDLSQERIKDGFKVMIDAANKLNAAADLLLSIDDNLWAALEIIVAERDGNWLRQSPGLGLSLSRMVRGAADTASKINFFVQDNAPIALKEVSGRGAPANLKQHMLARSIAYVWMTWVKQRPVKTRVDITTVGDESFTGVKDQPFTRFCSEVAALLPVGSLENEGGMIRMAVDYACEDF